MDDKDIKDLMLANDALADELKRVEWYANCLEQKIIDKGKQNKELFNKTIEFFEQHLPSMYIEEYKKTVADLVE